MIFSCSEGCFSPLTMQNYKKSMKKVAEKFGGYKKSAYLCNAFEARPGA